MKFRLDENFGRRGAAVMRQAGHDVDTVADEGLCSADDRSLLAACRVEGRCIVSLDLDFANPLLFPPWDQAGIVVLRVNERATAAEIDSALRTLVAGLRQEDVTGKLWIAEPGRIRKYQGEREDET